MWKEREMVEEIEMKRIRKGEMMVMMTEWIECWSHQMIAYLSENIQKTVRWSSGTIRCGQTEVVFILLIIRSLLSAFWASSLPLILTLTSSVMMTSGFLSCLSFCSKKGADDDFTIQLKDCKDERCVKGYEHRWWWSPFSEKHHAEHFWASCSSLPWSCLESRWVVSYKESERDWNRSTFIHFISFCYILSSFRLLICCSFDCLGVLRSTSDGRIGGSWRSW